MKWVTLWFANQLYKEGLIDEPPMYQICLGIPWGAPADTSSMKVMADMIPQEGIWAGFGIGRTSNAYGSSSCNFRRKCTCRLRR